MAASSQLLPGGIFTRLSHLNLSDNAAVIEFVKNAYEEILSQGYQEGSGDRELFKAMLRVEEKNGTHITPGDIANLSKALDIYELYENQVPLPLHESQRGLVGVYNMVAESMLDVREKNNYALESIAELIKFYTISYSKKNPNLLSFVTSMYNYVELQRKDDAIIKDHSSSLSELLYGMTLLKLLIDKILQLETDYAAQKKGLAKEPKNAILKQLQNDIDECAQEAKESVAQPDKWFHDLWKKVVACEKKFHDSSRDSGLYSRKLSTHITTTILKDKAFIDFAKNCAKNAASSPVSDNSSPISRGSSSSSPSK